MIKFKALIHKETGILIKYEEWLETHYSVGVITLNSKSYNDNQMLFSDDFEIIYDSEFTYRELRNIYLSMNDKGICNKVRNIMEFIQEHDPEIVEKELDEIYKKRKSIESGENDE